ncbi:ADP-ribosylation factor-like [Primulina tabacum]|uniref:ADP-ribosylation factor-like n=1 Tax=Primulina tabacum TaxID=48773 RepID=UPI003F5960E6
MGQAFGKLYDDLFGNSKIQIVMHGLHCAGKTTVLYKLHSGVVPPNNPTVGFNVEEVQYRDITFTMLDMGGRDRMRPIWRHFFYNTSGLIYVVDSADRESIGWAKENFQAIISHPYMINAVILVFANKQDIEGAMTPTEVCEGLGLYDIKDRKWHIQATCAIKGEGLYEGLAWLACKLQDNKAATKIFYDKETDLSAIEYDGRDPS